MIDIRVINNGYHWNVYYNDEFICAVDTLDEAHEELKKWVKKDGILRA